MLNGVRNESSHWLKSYLCGHSQKCLVNCSLSRDRAISCGVLQGTFLASLLFLLNTNDLPNCLEHSAANIYDIDQSLNTE